MGTTKQPASFHDDTHILSFDPPDVGENGPDSLLDVSPAAPIPLASRLFQAWQSRGYSISGDVWAGKVGGMSHVVRSIYGGVRSTSNCFIKGKSNITILTSTLAELIVIKNGEAEGVVVQNADGRAYYQAQDEVIVSCGVFESPKLLMLSGIGPQEELLAMGIPCLADSPQVGKNLQDHPVMPHVFEVPEELSMDWILRPGFEHDKAAHQYKSTKTGPFTSGLLEVSAFSRIDERLHTCKEWRNLMDAQGSDPLGPHGQPHFELDFVVCFCTELPTPTKSKTDVALLRKAVPATYLPSRVRRASHCHRFVTPTSITRHRFSPIEQTHGLARNQSEFPRRPGRRGWPARRCTVRRRDIAEGRRHARRDSRRVPPPAASRFRFGDGQTDP